MAKQTLGQGDSNVVVRNQVVYGALPQDVIDRMGDTTLALQTTEQNVLPAINELKSNLTYKTDHVTGQTEFIVPSTATEVIVVCYVDSSTACGVFHLPNPRTLPIDLRPVTGYNIVANTAGGYIYINVNHTTGGIQLLNFTIGGQEKRANATLYFYYR